MPDGPFPPEAPNWIRCARYQRVVARKHVAIADAASAKLRALSGMGPPPRHFDYDLRTATNFLSRSLTEWAPDIALFQGPEVADYGMAIRRRFANVRFVMDFCDSPTLIAERAHSNGAGVTGLQNHLYVARTRLFERRVRAKFDQTMYISAQDANHVGVVAGRPHPVIVPNGVLNEDPTKPLPLGTCPHRPTLGFLGRMNYAPNVRAALRLHDQIFQPMRAIYGDLALKIIGRSPVPEIRALASPDVEVTGDVEDLWAAMAGVSLFVFPMATGAGLQNKVLEAMYLAKPVILTPICADSVQAADRTEYLVADTDEALIACVKSLLDAPGRADTIGASGRTFVLTNFAWETLLPRYEQAVIGN